jgi:hypothetical protein
MSWKDIITQVKYQKFNVPINHQNGNKFCRTQKQKNGGGGWDGVGAQRKYRQTCRLGDNNYLTIILQLKHKLNNKFCILLTSTHL